MEFPTFTVDTVSKLPGEKIRAKHRNSRKRNGFQQEPSPDY